MLEGMSLSVEKVFSHWLLPTYDNDKGIWNPRSNGCDVS
jgi:hypothetical protein